ncbi:hypothetical protein STEG23_001522 [Scotinomys teguina]
MYPDLAELEDSDVSDDGSDCTEGVQSIIEQLESTNIQGKDGGKGIKGKGSAKIGTFPTSCRLPSAPPTYGTRGSSNSFSLETWRMVRSDTQLAYPVFQDPQGQRYHKPLDFKVIKSLAESDQQDPVWVPERLVRRIPEDRKAEDVASMDDVASAEPAVVDDIGPAVPPNGDRA